MFAQIRKPSKRSAHLAEALDLDDADGLQVLAHGGALTLSATSVRPRWHAGVCGRSE